MVFGTIDLGPENVYESVFNSSPTGRSKTTPMQVGSGIQQRVTDTRTRH